MGTIPLLLVLLLAAAAVAFGAGSNGVSNLLGARAGLTPRNSVPTSQGTFRAPTYLGTRFSAKLYIAAMLLLGILGVAFVYEIGRGGLEWDAVTRRARRPLLPRVA